ncbi:MAG: alpha/beta fold hydrolase [Actinomycetes bacterium]
MSNVEVLELGSGPDVVMVHGDVSGATATWSEQAPLGDRFRLRMVNRRGFGNSTDTDAEDFEVDAADVAELLDTPAHLVGHSYGGVVALLAASLRPEQVRSLTVFEPPALGLTIDRPETAAFVERITSIVATAPTPEEFLPQFVVAVGGDPARLPSPLPPPVVKAASIQLHGRWPWEARIPLEDLAAAPFPKLVVSGGHSALFDGVCDVLEASFGCRREVLAGAGHGIPMLGAPVNDLLAEFWSSVG